jgi:hypothetical protein
MRLLLVGEGGIGFKSNYDLERRHITPSWTKSQTLYLAFYRALAIGFIRGY